jgi:hypothetical protein
MKFQQQTFVHPSNHSLIADQTLHLHELSYTNTHNDVALGQ